jgi:hypothetical protein
VDGLRQSNPNIGKGVTEEEDQADRGEVRNEAGKDECRVNDVMQQHFKEIGLALFDEQNIERGVDRLSLRD